MHAGSVIRSDRLRKTLDVLRAAGERGVTTREIARQTGSQAVHSDCAALREAVNGFDVTCKYDHTTPDGNRVYRYVLNGTV